jgi:hypothetical protein
MTAPTDAINARIAAIHSPEEQTLVPPRQAHEPKQQTPKRPVCITIKTAVRDYSICRTKLWQLRRDKKIKVVKFGRRGRRHGVRIVVSSLEHFLGLDHD